MKKYAIVDSQNIVTNVIVWDEESSWAPPDNHSLIKIENLECQIGWTHVNGSFVAPINQNSEPVPAPSKEQLLVQLQTLQNQIQSLE